MTDWTNVYDVLGFLAKGGFLVLFGLAQAYLFKNWQFWANLNSGLKAVFTVVISAAIAVGATYAMQFDLSGVQPWFAVVAGTVLVYLASQGEYIRLKGKDYGATRTK